MIRSTNYCDRLSNRSMSCGWQFGSGFRELHLEFPGFVEENDSGGEHRHAHRMAAFVQEDLIKCTPSKFHKSHRE